MARFMKAIGQPVVADGTPGVVIRLLLVAAGLGVLMLGLFRLPSIAATQGEFVTGVLLSLAVAAQILAAAMWFPIAARRT